jgi:two-component system, OmpR family, alkaline phosphatase synthesis response regulator PhoP
MDSTEDEDMATGQTTILVVEDDPALAAGLAHNLGFEGYRVLQAQDGETGLRKACDERPDLVILDLTLPAMSGWEVLQAMREAELQMPVIILSARGREEDKVRGLRLGADDYVAKPFGLQELLARVEAALRRASRERAQSDELELSFGDIRIFPAQREVSRGGSPVHLTARELDLLLLLVRNPGRAFEREHLLRKVWGFNYEGTERTVDNFIRKLRAKLEADPSAPHHLVTVHGIGYRFEP